MDYYSPAYSPPRTPQPEDAVAQDMTKIRKSFSGLQGWFRQRHNRPSKSTEPLPPSSENSEPSNVISEVNISCLPDDVLVGVFSNLLDLTEFPNLALVCRLWCQLSDDQHLWKQRWFNKWNISVLTRESVLGSVYDWKKICMEHHLTEQESPSYTRPLWRGFGVSNARIEEGPSPVYFSPIVANVKLTSGRWVYEVEIKKFSMRQYYKRQPKRALDQLAHLMDITGNDNGDTAEEYENEDEDDEDRDIDEISDDVLYDRWVGRQTRGRKNPPKDDYIDSDYEDDDVFVDRDDEMNREPKGASTEEEEEEEQERNLYSGSLIAQIGWVSMRFYSPQVDMYGVGDDRHSWGYDGCRRFLFYGGIVRRRGSTSQVHRLRYAPDARWTIGDVIGVAIDIEDDETRLEYFVNGKSLGLAPCEIRTPYHAGGFFPALSRSRSGDKAQYVFRFGTESCGGNLKYDYPGYQPIGCDALEKLAASKPPKPFAVAPSIAANVRGLVKKSIRVAPLVPVATQFATHSFAVSVVADAEEISFVSWDEGVVRARVEFIRNSIHPTWSIVYGYNSRQYTRIIRYLKWDGTPWSARIVYDSRTGKHTLCHWPAGDQDKRDFAMESDTSAGSDSEEEHDDETGENPKAKSTKVSRISDNTEDLMVDIASSNYVAPAGSYLDPALTYRGSSNSKCTACPVDFEAHETKDYSRETSWMPHTLRRF